MANENVLLQVNNLKKYFKTAKGQLHAVDDITFSLDRGKTLGVVGESGCGKSTLGRTILNLVPATSGEVIFDGIHVESADGDNVNIQLPVGAVRKIIKATGKLPIPDTQTTNVDFAELLDAVCDLLDAEVQGDLINIEAADGDNVRIYVE